MVKSTGVVLFALLCGLGASRANAWTTGSDSLRPEVIVLLVYSLQMECGQQQPDLKTKLGAAYAAWRQRNIEVVKPAERNREIAEMMRRVEANDYPGKADPVPIDKCRDVLKALNDPVSDFVRK